LTYSVEASCHLRPSPTENSSFRYLDNSSLFVVWRRILFLLGRSFSVIFPSRVRNVVKFDCSKSYTLSDASTLDELLSFNEFMDSWRHSSGSDGSVSFLSSVIIGTIGSGCGEELFIVGFTIDSDDEVFSVVTVGEVFVVDDEVFSVVAVGEVSVADDEVFSGVAVEVVFDVDDDVFFIVDDEEFFNAEGDDANFLMFDEEVFLDNVAGDWSSELLKPGFDDVIETGSEADDNDESGRLLLSIWDFDRWRISLCVIESFEDTRDKLLLDDLRNEIGFDITWSCSIGWSSNVCFHSFDVEHSRIGGGSGSGGKGIGDGIVRRGKISVKNPPSPVSLEDAESIRLVLYSEFVKLNGECRCGGIAISEFIQKAWIDGWSFPDITWGIFSDEKFNW